MDTDEKDALVSFILRAGLAIVFLYAAVSAYLEPDAWIGFIPDFVKTIIDAKTFLVLHEIGNLILGLWILSNKGTFYASIIAGLAMFGIVVFNFGAMDILFRDIAIMFSAIALAVLSYKRR